MRSDMAGHQQNDRTKCRSAIPERARRSVVRRPGRTTNGRSASKRWRTLANIPLSARWRKRDSDFRKITFTTPHSGEENPGFLMIDVASSPETDDKEFFDANEDLAPEELRVTIYKELIKQNLLDYMKSSVGNVHSLEDISQGKITPQNVEKTFADKPQIEKSIAFLWSALMKKKELLPGFLECGAELNFWDLNGFSALHLAALSGDVEACRFLISKGIDVNLLKYRYTPLHLAAFGNSFEVARLLLNKGAEIKSSEDGDTPLHSAVKANAVECLVLLMNVVSDINSIEPSGMAPLHVAADLRQIQCLKLLLSCDGIDLNVKTRQKQSTPLHLAAENGYHDCVTMLLSRGANPGERNSRGQTALHLAAKAHSIECVEALLASKGCDVNSKDNENRTPLHAAVSTNTQPEDIVKLLIRGHAEVNARDNYGCTPLHFAALNELPSCVEILFHHGADITAKTNVGVTALNIITRKLPACLEMMHKKLDESISIHDAEGPHKETELSLDFRNLIQHSKQGEINFLQTIVQDGHKEILEHPLCNAFLYLKWLKIRKFYICRLIFCFLFCLSFTAFAFSLAHVCEERSFHQQNKTEILYNDTHRPNLTRILNDTNHSINFTILLTTESENIRDNFSDESKCHKNEHISSIWTTYVISPYVTDILFIAALILTVLEMFRKVFYLSSRTWVSFSFLNIEHFFEWFIIVTIFILSMAMHVESITSWHRYLAAIAVLFAWANFMIKIGQLPFFGPYVPMFLKVLSEFGKIFLGYCCLLIGFTISLCIILPTSDEFTYPHVGFLKVLVMMIGELNLINFITTEKGNTNAGFLFVFVIFVFLVTIVMMNLLVGIAVHDIQGLQKTAGLSKLERQVNLISDIEQALFNIRWYPFPKYLMGFLRRTALVFPSSYKVVIHVKPLHPKEQRLPKNILKEAYKIAKNRKRYKTSSFEKCGNCAKKNGKQGYVKNLKKSNESSEQGVKLLSKDVQELKTAIVLLLESIERKGSN